MITAYQFSKKDLLKAFILLTISASFLNVFYFMCSSAIPIIQEDAWYFLDVDVIKWANEGFHAQDLFVKRGLVDHVQPLNKFFLYLNYRLFNLDFRFESLLGFFGLISIAIAFIYHFFQRIRQDSFPLVSSLIFLMAMFTLASLNATGLYSWTLVTFSFLPLGIAILAAWCVWQIVSRKQIFLTLPFLLVAFVVVGDTAAIILWVSIAITVLLLNFKDTNLLFRSFAWLAAIGIYVGLYFLILNYKFLLAESGPAVGQPINLLDINFYLESIRIIFSSTLVQAQHLEVFGGKAKLVSWIIAIPVFYFYIRYFLRLLLTKKSYENIDFVITFILVYATVSIAAIVFGRVPEFGLEYLNQPRYVLVYQLIPFALLLNWSYSTRLSLISNQKLGSVAVIAMFVIFSFVQLGYDAKAHKSVRWISQWVSNQVDAISNYASNPQLASGNCTLHSKPVCSLPMDKRNQLLSFLISHQLNLFNTDFQWKYRVFPSIKLDSYSVEAWGPQEIPVGSPTQGIWIKFFQPIQASLPIQIIFGEQEIDNIYISGNVVTFDIPPAMKLEQGEYVLKFKMAVDGAETTIGEFKVVK
jgi:hypothetical protein